MNVAIIGSRDFKNKELLDTTMKKIQEQKDITKIISGGAKGADTMGVQKKKKKIPQTEIKKKWKEL